MADEPVVETPVEPVVEPVVEAAGEPAVEPHPLEPEGARFKEVYARMKQAEDRAQRLEAERAALLVQQRPAPPPVQYTPEQVADYLQQQVDRGLMTPMAATNALSQFNARREATQTAIQVEQTRAANQLLQEAANEVNAYIAKIPALNDTNSAEFSRVRDAAFKVSRRMGLPVTDFRVQQTALESVYGGLDRIAAAGAARQQSREASVPHVETGGRPGNTPVKAGDTSWKKDIPAEYLAFWEKRGYTEEQMKREAKYVTRAPRKVAARSK